MTGKTYDRRIEDLGNIVHLEHCNVTIPSQQHATAFYIVGLGLTRDPYMHVGLVNMWANAGMTQFHLPTAGPQVFRGRIGLVVPDLDALQARLASVKAPLEGTRFGYAVENGHVTAACPWGNRIRCHAPGPEFGDVTLGIVYVEFDVPAGAADGIRRFYERVMAAPATTAREGGAAVTRVPVGHSQQLRFRESAGPIPPYDGHHIAIYVANFSGPHRILAEHGLVSEESDQHQYRFEVIADPDTWTPLFEIQHEVRSLQHPLWARPLVNRNTAQQQRAYARGRDAFFPGA